MFEGWWDSYSVNSDIPVIVFQRPYGVFRVYCEKLTTNWYLPKCSESISMIGKKITSYLRKPVFERTRVEWAGWIDEELWFDSDGFFIIGIVSEENSENKYVYKKEYLDQSKALELLTEYISITAHKKYCDFFYGSISSINDINPKVSCFVKDLEEIISAMVSHEVISLNEYMLMLQTINDKSGEFILRRVYEAYPTYKKILESMIPIFNHLERSILDLPSCQPMLSVEQVYKDKENNYFHLNYCKFISPCERVEREFFWQNLENVSYLDAFMEYPSSDGVETYAYCAEDCNYTGSNINVVCLNTNYKTYGSAKEAYDKAVSDGQHPIKICMEHNNVLVDGYAIPEEFIKSEN
ncbi:MAG: hypothetical protein MJ133_06885 [Lachnospiraceae bacterium]|nr:hypothetical protein [Lachnospiraceae bacterium]